MGMTIRDCQRKLESEYKLKHKKDFVLEYDAFLQHSCKIILIQDGIPREFADLTWQDAFDSFKHWYENNT